MQLAFFSAWADAFRSLPQTSSHLLLLPYPLIFALLANPNIRRAISRWHNASLRALGLDSISQQSCIFSFFHCRHLIICNHLFWAFRQGASVNVKDYAG